jgi:hypothetical protein
LAFSSWIETFGPFQVAVKCMCDTHVLKKNEVLINPPTYHSYVKNNNYFLNKLYYKLFHSYIIECMYKCVVHYWKVKTTTSLKSWGCTMYL